MLVTSMVRSEGHMGLVFDLLSEVALKCEWSGTSSLMNIFKIGYTYTLTFDLEFVPGCNQISKE